MDSFRMRVEQIRAPSLGCRMVPSRRSPGAVTGIGTDIASSARYVKALVVVQVFCCSCTECAEVALCAGYARLGWVTHRCVMARWLCNEQ